MLVLQNALLQASFDPATGALVALVSRATGWPIQRRAELGQAFRLLVPIPDRRNNPVLGQKQGRPRATATPVQITFTWDRLVSEHAGMLDISLTQTITLTPEGLSFQTAVTNRSPYVVECVSSPILADLSCPPGSDHLDRLTAGYCGADRGQLFPKFNCGSGYFGFDYPIHMAGTPHTPLVLLDSGKEGLYAGCHDTSAQHLVMFTFELKPGWLQPDSIHHGGTVPTTDTISGEPAHVEFYTTHFPFLAPQQSVTLAPIVLAPYVGSWHKGADIYRTWRKTWFTPPRAPQWSKEVHSWQQIHINSPEDELRCRYTDLVKYGEDCAKHGVEAIQLVGWNDGGQDRGNPSHDTDPRLGTREELKQAIAKIHKLGVKMILFNKYTWADRSLPNYRSEYYPHAAKDPYGDDYVYNGYCYQTPTQLANINTRRLIPMCPLSPAWRAVACQEFQKSIDLGAAGMLYDEGQHHSPAQYCWDPSHGHAVPAFVYAGDAFLAQDFRRLTAAQCPDYLFAVEASSDLGHRFYSVSYTRIFATHVPLQRYFAPETEIMIAIVGHDDRNTLNQCLLYRYIISYEPRNFKGRLEEFPLTLEYGKKVDGLRQRYAEWLWHADFQDTQGATVTPGDAATDKSTFAYTVFRHRTTGKRAVVVANYHATNTLGPTIALDPAGRFGRVVTPESPDPGPVPAAVSVPPRSIAVFLEA